jgi:hypothetical protein
MVDVVYEAFFSYSKSLELKIFIHSAVCAFCLPNGSKMISPHPLRGKRRNFSLKAFSSFLSKKEKCEESEPKGRSRRVKTVQACSGYKSDSFSICFFG